jgi:hypothetical protein
MSTTSTRTEYSFSWVVDSTAANFVFASDVGMTDEMAFALNNYFLSLGWGAETAQATVTKRTITETDYREDDTTTPPSFA